MKTLSLLAVASLLTFGCAVDSPEDNDTAGGNLDNPGNTNNPGNNPGNKPGNNSGTPGDPNNPGGPAATIDQVALATLDASTQAATAADSALANAEEGLVAQATADINTVLTASGNVTLATNQFNTMALAVAAAATDITACDNLVFVADLAAGLVNEEPPVGFEQTVFDATLGAADAAGTALESAELIEALDLAAQAEVIGAAAEGAAAPLDAELEPPDGGDVVAALQGALDLLACP